MKFRVLGSSSKGNCYLLESENETLIIEAGVSFKDMKIGLDFNLRNVVGCLVTHEHGDHSKSMRDLLKAGIDVYTSMGTARAVAEKYEVIETYHRLHFIKSFIGFKVGNFVVIPMDAHHDAAEPLAFIISHKEMGSLLFATDTYYLEYKFKNLHHILIECNYSEKILQRNIDNNLIETNVASRLSRSHMSLENVKELIKANNNPNLKNIVLLHLSDGNSNAKEFKEVMEDLTHKRVEIADKGLEIELGGTKW